MARPSNAVIGRQWPKPDTIDKADTFSLSLPLDVASAQLPLNLVNARVPDGKGSASIYIIDPVWEFWGIGAAGLPHGRCFAPSTSSRPLMRQFAFQSSINVDESDPCRRAGECRISQKKPLV